MAVTRERSEGKQTIRLGGLIDIASAADLKAALIESIQPGIEASIVLDQDAELDITALQLLCAAARETKQQGSRLFLTEAISEHLQQSLEQAGFQTEMLPAAAEVSEVRP